MNGEWLLFFVLLLSFLGFLIAVNDFYYIFYIFLHSTAYHVHNEEGKEEELTSISQTMKVPGIAAIGIFISFLFQFMHVLALRRHSWCN